MFRPNRTHNFFLLLTLVAVFAVPVFSAKDAKDQQSAVAVKSTTAPASSAQYVGSETCKGCHEEVEKGFHANPHVGLLESDKKPADTAWHGCESCHGPGSAHVEGGGDKTKILNFKDL